MRFYTRQGDAGFTKLASGKNVRKSDLRIQSCGEIDELNSLLGWLHSHVARQPDLAKPLDSIQKDLFILGAELSSPHSARKTAKSRLTSKHVRRLEKLISDWEPALPALHGFIIPRGHPLAAAAHWARCVCRRAERTVAQLAVFEKINPPALSYLNRLSSWLFVFALGLNKRHGVPENYWRKK